MKLNAKVLTQLLIAGGVMCMLIRLCFQIMYLYHNYNYVVRFYDLNFGCYQRGHAFYRIIFSSLILFFGLSSVWRYIFLDF